MSLLLSDNFNRADAAAGSVGNGWIDPDAKWSISGNKLVAVGGSISNWLSRPATEVYGYQRLRAKVTVSAGGSAILLVRADAGAKNGYAAWVGGGTLSISKVTANGFAPQSSGAVADGTYWLSLLAKGSAIVATISTLASPAVAVASVSLTDSTYPTGGVAVSPLADYGVLDDLTVAEDLTPGSPVFVRTSPTSIAVTSTAAAGGAGPYASRWLSAAAVDGSYVLVPGSDGPAAVLANLTPGTTYFLRESVTDATGYNEWGSPIEVRTQPADLRTLVIVGLGDSITYGGSPEYTPLTPLKSILQAKPAYPGGVTTVNCGVSGSTTYDWLPGTTNFAALVAAVRTSGANAVNLMIGTNDSKAAAQTSRADYRRNLRVILAALAAMGLRVLVSEPPAVVNGSFGEFDGTSNARLVEYGAEVTAACDGVTSYRTGVGINAATAADPSGLLRDGIHPTVPAGVLLIGQRWADGYDALGGVTLSPAGLSAAAAATLAATIDGESLSTLLAITRAVLAGQATATDNGNNTTTLAFKRPGGATAATIIYNPTTGARS